MLNPWDEINSKLNIIDVIADYTPVKQYGSSYKCKCPFHNDNSPSLHISPDKNLWHCFGCGAGGNMFKFVTDFENITRKEALEKLAVKAGVELKKQIYKKPNKEEIKKIQEVKSQKDLGLGRLDSAAKIYHQILKKHLKTQNHITSFIAKRKLKPETITDFCLGYAPSGNFLLNLINNHNLSKQLFLDIGLIKKRGDGSLRDTFTDRFMIPIQNLDGQIIGFTGRIINNQDERPKYLNSPESIWFYKSEIWFGWNHFSKNIRRQKQALVLEGNMDVISASMHGLDFSIASQGTSVTTTHIKKLKYLTNNVLLGFDNDIAGEAASERFFKLATEHGLKVQKVLIPKTFKDLDEWLLSKNEQEIKGLKLAQIPFMDWLIEKNKDFLSSNTNYYEQKENIDRILGLMLWLDDFEINHYLKKISLLSRKPENLLFEKILALKKNKPLASFELEKERQSADFGPKKQDPKKSAALVTFQKLIYLSQKDELNDELNDYISAVYPLIRYLLEKEFVDYKNLDIYKSAKIEELKLQYSDLKPEDVLAFKTYLNQFFNHYFVEIAGNPLLLEAYSKLL